MKNEEKFPVCLALTELDDRFISEIAEEKPRADAAKRRLVPLLAAAVSALMALLLILAPRKKPKDHSVYTDPTDPPAGTLAPYSSLPTERATEASPTGSHNGTETASPLPSLTPYAGPTETSAPSQPGSITPAPTDMPSAGPTPIQTAGPTAGPTALPTAGSTAVPSSWPTAGPTAGPTPPLTAEPSAAPTPTAITFTPAPTAAPTAPPTPVGTALPSSTPTPAPTLTPAPTASPSIEPSEIPGEPELIYYSFEDFERAVREHENRLLEGLETYYAPHELPPICDLMHISVSAEAVKLNYCGSYNRTWVFSWYRRLSGSQLSQIAAENEGEWHGSRFVQLLPAGAGMNCWWAQYGVLFKAEIPEVLDEAALLGFCTAEVRTAAN